MVTVHATKAVHTKLKELSVAEHRSISQVIEEAIDRYQRGKFWAEMHESFARLRVDPAALLHRQPRLPVLIQEDRPW